MAPPAAVEAVDEANWWERAGVGAGPAGAASSPAQLEHQRQRLSHLSLTVRT